MTRPSRKREITFFSMPLLSVTLLAAALSAIAGGVAALVAVIRDGERSIQMLLPVIVGAFVVFFGVGELLGG